jgi:hypothetical protein
VALTGGDCDSCRASQEALDGTSVHIQNIQLSCKRVSNGIESCLICVCTALNGNVHTRLLVDQPV